LGYLRYQLVAAATYLRLCLRFAPLGSDLRPLISDLCPPTAVIW
jgi:hypothetical protein